MSGSALAYSNHGVEGWTWCLGLLWPTVTTDFTAGGAEQDSPVSVQVDLGVAPQRKDHADGAALTEGRAKHQGLW